MTPMTTPMTMTSTRIGLLNHSLPAWLFGLGLIALTLLAGCSSGTPGIDRESGMYYQHIKGSPEIVTAATRSVLNDMGYLAIEQSQQGPVTHVHYRTAFDTQIEVTIARGGEDHSRVGVIVRPGQSEGLSVNILQRIAQRVDGRR